MQGKKVRLGLMAGAALMMAAGVVSTGLAQTPGGDPGMGPHRPPLERAFGGPNGSNGPDGMRGPMGGGMHGDHGRWWNDAKAIEKFKLTDTQRKSMDDIYQQHRMTLVDLHATLEKQELAMEPLIRADQPDEGKILSQIDRVAQARAELEKANARMLFGIRKELTPEQWKLMQADRAARLEKRGPGGDVDRDRLHKWHGAQGRAGSGSGAGSVSGPGVDAAPPNPNGPSGPNGSNGPDGPEMEE